MGIKFTFNLNSRVDFWVYEERFVWAEGQGQRCPGYIYAFHFVTSQTLNFFSPQLHNAPLASVFTLNTLPLWFLIGLHFWLRFQEQTIP